MATVEAETRAEAVVDLLGALYYGELSADDFMLFPGEDGVAIEFDDEEDIYWQQSYGGQAAFECLVRTVLSQNTSDTASQPAHHALMERYGGGDLADALARASHADLADTISSAGLYNQKAERIIAIAEEVGKEFGGADGFDEFVEENDPEAVRERLLAFGGVGPKTADCVLLFAGGQEGVFPVDTHVHRLYRRLGVAPPDADHEEVREVLESEVPGEKCGFGHTATIQFGRDYCSARRPACLEGPEACPLYDLCDRVGVNETTDDVVDPADSA